MACAQTLIEKDKNLSVAIAEGCDRLGKKIAATGNGQGNLSNADMSPNHYHGSGKFLAEKLCCGGLYDPRNLFDFLCVKDRLGRIYPASKQASAISDSLIRRVSRGGVKIYLATRATSVKKGFIITLSNGETLTADYVVLAAGGKAQKQFGTDGNGYALATSLGHTVTQLQPSLVQLKCDTRHIKTLKGIRTECRLSAYCGEELLTTAYGDVIFTDYGVSGNAVFYASAYCAGKSNVTLSIEFLPDVSAAEIEENVRRKLQAGYEREELLCGTLHNQLGRAVMRRVNGCDPSEIAAAVKGFTLPVLGSLGYDYAQVTKGGVLASEVDNTLQSKLVANLYLAGEILDVDGDCGGYNLTWAFCSGTHAANSILNAVNAYD